MKNKPKILLVDDEYDILEFLSYNLKREGFVVFTANNGIQALEIAQKEVPDLIILDVMMPNMDGIAVCERIRSSEKTQQILILFLTARSEEYSEVAGFDAGADDYVTKPIKPKLLISRVNALLKRKRFNEKNSRITIEALDIYKDEHKLICNNKELDLARKEFNLLYLLMTIPGKVFSRQEIIKEVWDDTVVGDRTIDVHVRKIREKIGNKYIKTIKGVGYKFDI